jgi:hypothetical protein
MYCWAVAFKACVPVPPLGDRTMRPTAVRNRQAAVQYLGAAGRSTDRRERERLRRLAADLILAH